MKNKRPVKSLGFAMNRLKFAISDTLCPNSAVPENKVRTEPPPMVKMEKLQIIITQNPNGAKHKP